MLISIVIPVFNLVGYLDQCLDSIGHQGFADLEIIAIDDGSTDGSGDILRRHAEHQPITIIRTEQRVGPGAARNLGAAKAGGDYLWFVDGDDLITAGALEAIASKLASDGPDVLFLDHELLYPNGELGPGSDHGLIAAAPDASFDLAGQPWAVGLSMVCWNKVINRQFLNSTGLEFSEQTPHEEIPLSCLLLPQARRLSVLKRPSYRYRQQRAGSVMVTGDPRRHFTIFAAYETVLDRVQKKLTDHDAMLSDEIYLAYFKRAIKHFTTIYEGGQSRACYLARGLRREFFGQMHFEYLRYRPAGYRPGRGPLEIKFRLIQAGAYRGYAVAIRLNKLRIWARDRRRPR